MKVSSYDSYSEDMSKSRQRYFYQNGEEDEGLEGEEINEDNQNNGEGEEMKVMERLSTGMRMLERIPPSKRMQERLPVIENREKKKEELKEAQCKFCEWKIKGIKFLRENLHIRYFDEFNFYFAKPINEIIDDEQLSHVTAFKDFRYFDDSQEYLKRYYRFEEVPPRVAVLTNFFTNSYKPTRPNLIVTKMHGIISKRNFRQTRLFLRLLKKNPTVSAAIQQENLQYNNQYQDGSSESQPSSLTTPQNDQTSNEDSHSNNKNDNNNLNYKILNSRLSQTTHHSSQPQESMPPNQLMKNYLMTEEQKQRALEYENYKNIIMKMSLQTSTHDIYYPSFTSSQGSLKNILQMREDRSMLGQYHLRHEGEDYEEEKKNFEEEQARTPLRQRSDIVANLVITSGNRKQSPEDLQKIAEQIANEEKKYDELLDFQSNLHPHLPLSNSSINSMHNNLSQYQNHNLKYGSSKRMSTYASQSNSLSKTFDPSNYILNATTHDNHKKMNPVLTNPSDINSEKIHFLKTPNSNLADKVQSPTDFVPTQIDFSNFKSSNNKFNEQDIKQTVFNQNLPSNLNNNNNNNSASVFNALVIQDEQAPLEQQKPSSSNSIQQIQRYILSQIKKQHDARANQLQNKSSFHQLHTSLSTSKSKERKDQETQKSKIKQKEQKNFNKYPLTKSGNIQGYRKQLTDRNFTEVNLGSVFEQLRQQNKASQDAKKNQRQEQPNTLESYLLKLEKESNSRNNSSKKRKVKQTALQSNTLFSTSISPQGITPRGLVKKSSNPREQQQNSKNIVNVEQSPPPISARGTRKISQPSKIEKKSNKSISSGKKITSPGRSNFENQRVTSPCIQTNQANIYPVKHSSQGIIGKSFSGQGQNQQSQQSCSQITNEIKTQTDSQFQSSHRVSSSSSAHRQHSNLNLRSKILTTNSTSNENKSSIHSPGKLSADKDHRNSQLKTSVSPPQSKQLKLIPEKKRGSNPKTTSPQPLITLTPQQQINQLQIYGKQTQTSVLKNNYFQQQIKPIFKSEEQQILHPSNQGLSTNLLQTVSQRNGHSEISRSNSQILKQQQQQQSQWQSLQSNQQQYLQLQHPQQQTSQQQQQLIPNFFNQPETNNLQYQQPNSLQRQVSPPIQSNNFIFQNGIQPNLFSTNLQNSKHYNSQILSTHQLSLSPPLREQTNLSSGAAGTKLNSQHTQQILENTLANTINKCYKNFLKENQDVQLTQSQQQIKSSSSHQFANEANSNLEHKLSSQYQSCHQPYDQNAHQKQQSFQQQPQQDILRQQQHLPFDLQQYLLQQSTTQQLDANQNFQSDNNALQSMHSPLIIPNIKSFQKRHAAPTASARQLAELKLKEHQNNNLKSEQSRSQEKKRASNSNQTKKSKKMQLQMRQKAVISNHNEANSLTGLASNQSINSSLNHQNYSHNNYSNANNNLNNSQTYASINNNNTNNQFLQSVGKEAYNKIGSSQANILNKQITPNFNIRNQILQVQLQQQQQQQQLLLLQQQQQQMKQLNQQNYIPFILPLPLHQLNNNITMNSQNNDLAGGNFTDRATLNSDRQCSNSERTSQQPSQKMQPTPKLSKTKINSTLPRNSHNTSITNKQGDQQILTNIPKEFRRVKTEANGLQSEDSQVLMFPNQQPNIQFIQSSIHNEKTSENSQPHTNFNSSENYLNSLINQHNFQGYPVMNPSHQNQAANFNVLPNDMIIHDNTPFQHYQQNSSKKKSKNSVITQTPSRKGNEGKQKLEKKREDTKNMNSYHKNLIQHTSLGGQSSVNYSPSIQIQKDDQELGNGFYTHRNPPTKNRKKSNELYSQTNQIPTNISNHQLPFNSKYIQSSRGSYQGQYSDLSSLKQVNAYDQNQMIHNSPPRHQSPPIFNSQYQIHASQSQSQLMQNQQQLLAQPANSSMMSQGQMQGGMNQQHQVAGILNHKIKQLSQKMLNQ